MDTHDCILVNHMAKLFRIKIYTESLV